MNELKLTAEHLKAHPEMSDGDRISITEEQDFRRKELIGILAKLPAIVKVAKDRLLVFVRNVNQQLAKYEMLA